LRQRAYKDAKERYIKDTNLVLAALTKHKDFINFLITGQSDHDKR